MRLPITPLVSWWEFAFQVLLLLGFFDGISLGHKMNTASPRLGMFKIEWRICKSASRAFRSARKKRRNGAHLCTTSTFSNLVPNRMKQRRDFWGATHSQSKRLFQSFATELNFWWSAEWRAGEAHVFTNDGFAGSCVDDPSPFVIPKSWPLWRSLTRDLTTLNLVSNAVLNGLRSLAEESGFWLCTGKLWKWILH